MKILKILLPFLAVLLLSYWSIKPFFLEGFFPMHDDTQVARVFGMHKSLSDGMFPVRWVADLGYNFGYPIFNFYAPLAYYFAGFIVFFGADSLAATKITMAVGILFAGLFMYLLAKEFWGRTGGVISALLYVYAPYHAVNVYVRGDVAEFWAYAFIPLVFYGIWKAYKEKQWLYIVIGSLGYAAVILSHNLTAMMISPFIFVICIYLFFVARGEKKLQKPYLPLLIIALGILLASFYWIPVFSEMKYTNVLSQVGGGADFKDHYVCPIQLWDSPWGFGGSTPTCIDGLSYKIGKLHILIFLIASVGLFFLRKQNKTKFWFSVIAVLSVVFAIFLMLQQSQFIWEGISAMAFFQYPWRFLLIVTFFISFLGGAIIFLFRQIIKKEIIVYCVTGLIAVIIVNFNYDLFVPQMYLKKTVDDYTNKLTLNWTTSKISDEYMPEGFFEPQIPNDIPQKKFSDNPAIEVVSLSEKTHIITTELLAKEKTDLLINHAYFPAWHVYLDGEKYSFKNSNKGLIITIPEGQHILSLRFEQTLIEKVANTLSLAGVLILITGIIVSSKQVYERKKT